MKAYWLAQRSKSAALVLGTALILAAPSLSFADTKMDQIFNDEAIQRYLGEAAPVVSYLTRIKMKRSHLAASALNVNAGNQNDAHSHVEHPMEEIWDGLHNSMDPIKAEELKSALLAAQDAVKKHDNAESIAAIDRATTMLLKLEQEAIKDKNAPAVLAEVAAVMLRTAVVEYHEAFDGKKIKNMVEFHDGAMFVREVQAMMTIIGPALQAKDPEAFASLNGILDKLYAAWPLPGAPDKIASVTRLQTLVSLAEIKLSALQ